jgi:hypothetical protein
MDARDTAWRHVAFQEVDHNAILTNAREQTIKRCYHDMFIVDVDTKVDVGKLTAGVVRVINSG